MMIATGFLSMWVSNTATTLMMLPIGLSVLALVVERRSYAGKWVTGFEKAAYRGGCQSLPELPRGTIRHEERYRHHRPASAGIC
jgi:sodium-dependent dicarboxylate transporter 2/3/5